MSQILVVVPSEWTQISYDEMAGVIGYSWQMFSDLQGRSATDLNERLEQASWFQDDRRVQDVLVLNETLYFKLG